MNRADAVRLVGKLREVRQDRGATPAEARLAREKANRLVAKFGLDRREAHPPPRRERKRKVHHQPPANPGWSFNVQTGEASENVKVHRHRGPSDWLIEVPIEAHWPFG